MGIFLGKLKTDYVHPLCVVSNGKYGRTTIQVNREGLAQLREALNLFENPRQVGSSFNAYENGNWKTVDIVLSSQEDFDCGAEKCTCGCQAKFEALHQQVNHLEQCVKTLEEKTFDY